MPMGHLPVAVNYKIWPSCCLVSASTNQSAAFYYLDQQESLAKQTPDKQTPDKVFDQQTFGTFSTDGEKEICVSITLVDGQTLHPLGAKADQFSRDNPLMDILDVIMCD